MPAEIQLQSVSWASPPISPVDFRDALVVHHGATQALLSADSRFLARRNFGSLTREGRALKARRDEGCPSPPNSAKGEIQRRVKVQQIKKTTMKNCSISTCKEASKQNNSVRQPNPRSVALVCQGSCQVYRQSVGGASRDPPTILTPLSTVDKEASSIMKCVAGRGSLIYLAAIAHLALLPCLPAVSAEGNKPEVHVSVDPTSSDEASQATQGSILDNSVSIEEDDESEFEEAPDDIPIPSAFERLPEHGGPMTAATLQKQPANEQIASAAASMQGPPATEHWVLSLWHLMLSYRVVDCAALLTLILVIVVAFKGKAENKRIAAQWLQSVKELLENQFASVAEANNGALSARSYNEFELFCSGRRNCMFMHATLQCISRQDLWKGHVFRRFLNCVGDEVTLEFLLPECGEGMIFGICRRLEQRKFVEALWDVTEFCKSRQSANLLSQVPEGFSVISDTQEAAEKILDIPGLQKLLQQLAPYLRCIYTSDLCTNTPPALSATIAAVYGTAAAGANKPKRVLRLNYILPEKDEEFDARLPVAVACKLVDALASLRLSDACRESVRKMRLTYEKEREKTRRKEQQEEAERRRQERKREEEKAIEKLPEEQRRKAQEAQAKKAAREQRREQRQGVKVSVDWVGRKKA
ncbi:coiled-coil domain-containing protein 47 [Cyclospora cayetanensis]|uniref:Coiled-coil domain-containing protein 47 n=1 Tax=Cyclospora cayetanensis TaxID=88456 RepID=A0A6P6RVS2_9EIME|nr:coiled-coil domain-containing protein 47 [Cyclospora cayetanensis]